MKTPISVAQPDAFDVEVEEELPVEEGAFQDIVRDTSPWLLAILFHLALLLVGILIVWAVPPKSVEESFAARVTTQKPMDVKIPDVVQVTDVTTDSPATFSPMQVNSPVPSPVDTPVMTPMQPGALRMVGSPMGNPNGQSQGSGNGDLFTGSTSGMPADTVFVIDASGSLVDTLSFVKTELAKVLNKSDAGMRFNLLFVAGENYNKTLAKNGVVTFMQKDMVAAEPEVVQEAIRWMEQIEPGGSGSTLAAIQAAIAMHPARVVVLSDNITGRGQWEIPSHELLGGVQSQLVQAEAAGHPVLMECYQFVHADPVAAWGEEPVLKQMASLTRADAGYYFISKAVLGLR